MSRPSSMLVRTSPFLRIRTRSIRPLALSRFRSQPQPQSRSLSAGPPPSPSTSRPDHGPGQRRSAGPPPGPSSKRNKAPLLLFALFPALYLLLPPSLRPSTGPPELDPQRYGTYRVKSVQGVSERHVLIEVDVPEGSRALFAGLSSGGEVKQDGQGEEGRGGRAGRKATIRHVCIKSPDLQIERPYTPINDVAADGVMRLVVKRVKGGEVGRHIHSLKPGDPIEIRGPVRTAEVDLEAYDQVAMISTGTGIAPFLQLLSILRNANTPSASSSTPPGIISRASSAPRLPRFTLIQYLPHSPFQRARPSSSSSSPTSSTKLVAMDDVSGDHEDDPMDIALHPALVPRVLGASAGLGLAQGHAQGQEQAQVREPVQGLDVRFLRIKAGATLDEADIAHAFSSGATSGIGVGGSSAGQADPAGTDGQSPSRGIWSFLGLSASSLPSASSSPPPNTASTPLLPHRLALLLCLPLAQLPPLVGPPPRGPASMAGPLGGLLGRMGWERRNVYVL